MNKLLLLTALLGVALAQQSKCPTPPVWEGRFMEVSNYRYRFAGISYDSENNRTRIIEEEVEEVNNEPQREYYDELFLHKEQIGYRFNLKTKECQKFRLTEPFRTIGVPADARYDEERVIGTLAVQGDGIETVRFEGETTRGFYAGEWIPLDHLCLPVRDFYYDRTDKTVIHWDIFDLTLGIKDPNVFIPRPECM